MNEQTTANVRRDAMKIAYSALLEKGYDPIKQLRGFLLSDDPTYIPDHKSARATLTAIDRKEVLDDLLLLYFEALNSEENES